MGWIALLLLVLFGVTGFYLVAALILLLCGYIFGRNAEVQMIAGETIFLPQCGLDEDRCTSVPRLPRGAE